MGKVSARSSSALNFGNGRCRNKTLQGFFGRAASICSQAASGNISKSLNSPAPRNHCAPSITTHSPLMYSAMPLLRNPPTPPRSCSRPTRFPARFPFPPPSPPLPPLTPPPPPPPPPRPPPLPPPPPSSS